MNPHTAPMNTTPTIRITEEGPEVGVATARLLLQHALEQEEQNENGDSPEMARKRAINAHTGASASLPLLVTPVEPPVVKILPAMKSESVMTEGGRKRVEDGLITDSQHRGD